MSMVILPVSVAMADPDEGLVWAFKAKNGVADGSTDTSNFRDQLTVSAASTKTFTFEDDGIHRPFFTNVTVKSGIANATYINQPCLFLDQPTNYIDGVLHSYEQRATIPNSMLAKSTEGASFFARIKWMGRSHKQNDSWAYAFDFYDNGCNWAANGKGWIIRFEAYGGVSGNAWMGIVVADKQAIASSVNVVTDESQWTAGKILGDYCDIYNSYEWVDIAVTLRAGSDRTYVTFFKCDSESRNVSIGRTFVETMIKAPSQDGTIFGSAVGQENTGGTKRGNFKGAVRELRLWNRCLSEEEMREVFAGQQQGWSVGVPNDSADEFSDTECATTFNPRTMPWSGMRKTLTAANPSVSLTATFPSDRRSLPRVLHIKPILSSEARGAKLDVGLNGSKIGEVLLRNDDCWLFVKERIFNELVSNDGIATFTLTRTGNMAGSVSFDFLELTGSFQLGSVNGSYENEFTWSGARTIYSTVEDTTIYSANLAPQKTLTVRFPLRQSVVDKYMFRLSTRLFWQTEAQLPLTFTLNDVAIAPTEEVSPSRTFHFDIEPGVLQEMNKFAITAGTSTRTEGDKDYGIDYYRLEVVNTEKTGFTMIVF